MSDCTRTHRVRVARWEVQLHPGVARGQGQPPRFALLLLLLFRDWDSAKTFRRACLRIQLRCCFCAAAFHPSKVFDVRAEVRARTA